MKRDILLSLSLASAFCLSAESPAGDFTSYFECPFATETMPAGMKVVDKDGCQLHFTMVQNGFSDYDSWICLRERGTENYYAASASRFKTAKGEDPLPAQDWMITPPVWIRGGEVKLTWRSMSVNEQRKTPSTYEIRVSATGDNPEDFAGEPLVTVTDEDINKWQEHNLDLSAYEGQRVRIAFVNISLDSEILAIDDINVSGLKGLSEILVTPGEYHAGSETFNIGGTITAYSQQPVNTLSVDCEVGGRTLHAEYSGLNLGYHESFDFVLPEEITAQYGETVDFTVSATVNGLPYDPMDMSTMVLSFVPKRGVVVEEATGMWCGYCPKGIVAMETLEEKYPDTFIGIAVHVDDDMSIDGYQNFSFPSGAPTAWVDRNIYCPTPMYPITENGVKTYTTLMGGLESVYREVLDQQALAEISLDAAVKGNTLEISASTRYPINIDNADYRIAFAVTEDKVWKKGYYQKNYMSGSGEVIGGFEDRPAMIVTDMKFNHVARAIYSGVDGIEGSVPSVITAGEVYPESYSFDLPRSILNVDNVKVIGMIIDHATGKILNAASVRPDTSESGVEAVAADSGLAVSLDKDLIKIGSALPENIDAALYDISGVCVARGNGTGGVEINTSSLSGIYILRAFSVSGETVLKLVI
jgi:thiol-disulfide isomerase/thioredoxin